MGMLKRKVMIILFCPLDNFAPIQVVPSNYEGVNAAYFEKTPRSIGTQLGGQFQISSVEYWNIESAEVNAGISLAIDLQVLFDLTSSSLAKLRL
jgi:hypothetical protein